VHLNLDEALFCHVGDSRLYHYDGTVLAQKTLDHEQYDERLQGTVLASYLGIDEKALGIKIQEESFKVKAGDRILMCSDGLYKQLDDARILQIIKENPTSTEQALETLCSEAEKAEHSDNVTVVLVEVEE
jgi:protein phosphatase